MNDRGEQGLSNRRAAVWLAVAVWIAAATSLAAGNGDGRAAAESAFQEARALAAEPVAESRRKALAGFRLVLERAQVLQDRDFEARVLGEIGSVQLDLGEPREALANCRRALDLLAAAGDPEAQARNLMNAGLALQLLGQLDEALDHILRAEVIAREIEQPKLLSQVLSNRGTLHYDRGERDTALALFEEALEIRLAADDPEGIPRDLANLGAVYFALGRTAEALENFRQGVGKARELGQVGLEVSLLNNLGAVYRSRGEIQHALDAFVHGLELAEQLGDRRREALMSINLGDLYQRLNEPEKALGFYRRALGLYREMEAREMEARVLMDLGWFHLSQGAPETASDLFEQALAMSREAKSPKIEANSLRGLGTASLALGELKRALDLLRQALAIQEQSANRLTRAGTLRNLGVVHRRLGNADAARDHLERSLAALEPFGDPERESATRFELARLLSDRGQIEAARDQAEAALRALESLRGTVPGPDLRASLLSGSQERFDFYVDLLMELDRRDPDGGFAAAAFRASERSRARSLAELLTEASFGLRSPRDPGLARSARDNAARISWLQRQLVRALSGARPDHERAERLRRQLAAADTERERLDREIRTQDPRYAEIRYPSAADLETVQRLLDPETAFLEYALGAERSFLFVVTREGLAVRRLAPAGEILELVRRLRALLEKPGRLVRGQLEDAARRAYDLLVAPAADVLEGKQNLLIAPDLDLYYLPFEVLRPAAGDYLITRWAIAYVPSGTVLKSLRSERRGVAGTGRRKEYVAFADPVASRAPPGIAADELVERGALGETTVRQWRPLPGARDEVSQVARLFAPEDVAVYLGADATEEIIKQDPWVSTARRLHFASHAFVDERRPAYSGLLLSVDPAGTEDGLLQAHEIFDLELAADLVVLSACETGLGKQVEGEGLIGLTRAFMFAGARRIVVSLWPVADRSTEKLMVHLYRNLEAGLDAGAALRGAKLELIREPASSHPYHWAPFILVGDGGDR